MRMGCDTCENFPRDERLGKGEVARATPAVNRDRVHTEPKAAISDAETPSQDYLLKTMKYE